MHVLLYFNSSVFIVSCSDYEALAAINTVHNNYHMATSNYAVTLTSNGAEQSGGNDNKLPWKYVYISPITAQVLSIASEMSHVIGIQNGI
jgi:hypothetical protein